MIEKIDNIILLGTSHVAKQSAKEIEEAIEIYKPEVVGIELDIDRLKTLLSSDSNANKKRRSNRKMIKEIGGMYFLNNIDNINSSCCIISQQ